MIINNMTSEDIILHDLAGQNILAGTQIDLRALHTIDEISNSQNLLQYISDGSLIFNNGEKDLSVIESIKYVIGTYFNLGGNKHIDGRPSFHQSSKPYQAYTCYISVGDDPLDFSKVGGGPVFKLEHVVGGSNPESVYIELNTIENKTYLHEGSLLFENCLFDEFKFYVVPSVTNYSVGSDTNYQIVGDIVIPVWGTGDAIIAIQDIKLVQMVSTQNTPAPGYWNAVYNNNTKQFDNITPASDGSGEFNIFIKETNLYCFADIVLLGSSSGMLFLQSSDCARIGHGTRFKLLGKTDNIDHDWKIVIIMTLHREKTI